MKSRYQNVVIDVSLDDKAYEQLKWLKNSPVLSSAEHVVFATVYNEKQARFLPLDIEDKEDFEEIERYVVGRLEDLKKELLPNGNNGQTWETRCIFNNDVQSVAMDCLEEFNADLAITATRMKNDMDTIFKDSFAYYLVTHAPCDVYVVRPVHEDASTSRRDAIEEEVC